MIIGVSPFQRALIGAALERYQADFEQDQTAGNPADVLLWIGRQEKTFSLSEAPGCICIVFSNSEQRAAAIGSLKARGYACISTA